MQAALRLDPIQAFDQMSDLDLRAEEREPDEMEELADEAAEESDDAAVPVTTAAVVRRYRRSFLKLLERGVDFVRRHRGSALGDLAFQTLMQQSERLLVTVEVDGEEQYLVDPADLRRFRLRVLVAYLKEDAGIDPLCAATARYHLADLIRSEHEWEPLEWETIENLGYRYAERLIRVPAPPDSVEILGMTGALSSAWLEEYAARADWLGVVEHVSETLWDIDFTLEPFPMIVGTGIVEPFGASPAWESLGYATVAGTSDEDPFGVAVRASSDGAYVMHALVYEPAKAALHEAIRRGLDSVLLARTYRPIGHGTRARRPAWSIRNRRC